MFFRNRALQDLRVELARVSGSLASLADHEARIRRFERYMYAVPVSVLTSAAAVIIAWKTGR